MDQRIRKLMTIHKALHPRDDVDRLHVSRKEEGRRLASIKDSVDASLRRPEDYIKKHEGRFWLRSPETIQTTQGSTEPK